MNEKICTKCKRYKLLIEFNKAGPKSRLKSGLSSWCKECLRIKSKEDYRKKSEEYKKYFRDYYNDNKSKMHDRQRKWIANNKEKYRNFNRKRHLKKSYNLTIKDFDKMVINQLGLCAICKNQLREKVNIDHCHKTNGIRGLLCNTCNFLLGNAKDNPDILNNAINYLQNPPRNQI